MAIIYLPQYPQAHIIIYPEFKFRKSSIYLNVFLKLYSNENYQLSIFIWLNLTQIKLIEINYYIHIVNLMRYMIVLFEFYYGYFIKLQSTFIFYNQINQIQSICLVEK